MRPKDPKHAKVWDAIQLVDSAEFRARAIHDVLGGRVDLLAVFLGGKKKPARKGSSGPVSEPHYRVKDLAELWAVSEKTIRRIFSREDSVLKIGNHAAGNRKCVTLSIPESVALRLHERLSKETFEAVSSSRNPRRVVLLRRGNGRVA
jgi:hypothetical protein